MSSHPHENIVFLFFRSAARGRASVSFARNGGSSCEDGLSGREWPGSLSGEQNARRSRSRPTLSRRPQPPIATGRSVGRRCSQWGAASQEGVRSAPAPRCCICYAQRKSATDDQEAAAADVIVKEAEVGRDVGCEERASYDGRRQQHAREQEKVCHAGAGHQGC